MTTLNTPPTVTKQPPMTADEFLAFTQLPENASKWFELVRGEVIEVPPPTRPHGAVCANVVFTLGSYVRQRRKGYITSNDSGVLLERDPDTVRGPDVALFEDATKFADLHPKYGEVPPILVHMARIGLPPAYQAFHSTHAALLHSHALNGRPRYVH